MAPPSYRVMTEADVDAWHVVGDREGIPPSPRTQRTGSLLTGLLSADLPLTDFVVVQDEEDRMRLVEWDMTPEPDDPVELLNCDPPCHFSTLAMGRAA